MANSPAKQPCEHFPWAREILAYWKAQNPALGRKLEQSGELNRLLRQMSDWTFDQMYQLGVIEKMPTNRALEVVRDNWSLPTGG